jgi:hypothetical protein
MNAYLIKRPSLRVPVSFHTHIATLYY